MQTFNRRYLVRPPRLEVAGRRASASRASRAIVQNASPYTYFGDRPVEMAEGATLDSGDLAGVVLERASPIDIPTVIWRALSTRARVAGHRRFTPFAGVHARCSVRSLRRPAAAAAGRRRLHRRGRAQRVGGGLSRERTPF